MSHEDGMSLIEIIIGLALLSVALIISVLTFAALVQLANRSQSARQTQQNGRFVLESISRDIRNATAASASNCLGGTNINCNKLDLSGLDVGGSTIEYTYDPAAKQIYRQRLGGACTSGFPPVDCQLTSVSGPDVSIPNPPNYTYVPGIVPFVQIDMTVQQNSGGATILPSDSFYKSYELYTTVSLRKT